MSARMKRSSRCAVVDQLDTKVPAILEIMQCVAVSIGKRSNHSIEKFNRIFE